MSDFEGSGEEERDVIRKEKRRVQQQNRRKRKREEETEDQRKERLKAEAEARKTNRRKATSRENLAVAEKSNQNNTQFFNQHSRPVRRRTISPSVPIVDPLRLVTPPVKGYLTGFETNPITALIAFATNSGLERYPNIYGLHNSPSDANNESIHSNDNYIVENGSDHNSNNTPELELQNENESEIIKLMEQIKTETLQIEEVQERIFLDFRKAWHSKALLTACASCGIRALKLGNVAYSNYEIEKLEVLKYSTEQLAELLIIPERFRRAISYFQYGEMYFHLHPEFVTQNDDNVTEATICEACEISINKGIVPKFSVAAGVDFGDPKRIGLPEPTLAEQYTIALSCPYVTILKLIGTSNSQRQSAKRGHSITYFHNAPKDIASVQNSLPRVSGIDKHLSVSFLGSQENWEAFQPSIMKSVPQLEVRPLVVYPWLKVLKAINPLYKDIEINNTEECIMALRNIPATLIENATIMESSAHQDMEEVIEMRTASFGERNSDLRQQAETSVNEVLPIPINDVFVTNTNYVDTGPMNPLSAVCLAMERTIMESTSEIDSMNDAQNEEEGDEVPDGYRLEDDDLENVPIECPPRIQISRSREPINEFSSNDKLLLSSFPTLFMLGRGINNKATLPTSVIRHMMFQFNCRIAQCQRFIFLLFDQLQRHAVARIVSARVKSDPVSMQKLGKLVKDPSFLTRLRAAAKNPNSEDARKILKLFSSHVALSSSKVPFSKQARKSGMTKLKALTGYHGMPGLFLTISPDDAHDPNRIRMSLPQENNVDFPAGNVDDFIEALKTSQTSFNNIPISSNNLRELLARGPAAAAEMFKIIIENLFSVVLSTPMHQSVKKTIPLPDRTLGVFGTPIASAGFVEEQGRGSLHIHIVLWAGFSPELLQAVGGIPRLAKILGSAIDNIITAEVDPVVHIADLLTQITGKKHIRAAYYSPHNPKTEPAEFANDVNRVIACSGIHKHNGTCRKCKAGITGCRLGRPQPLHDNTCVMQIVPKKNERGSTTFQILENVEQMPPLSFDDSIHTRDKRILIWELKRKLIVINRIPNPDGSLSRSLMFDNSNIRHEFPQAIQEDLDKLSESKLDLLLAKLRKRNGLVVEYNKLISGLYTCNTNVALLGSYSQAKNLLLYLLKYVTKGPDDLQAAVTVLHHARVRMNHYPSQAEDANTDGRHAIRFLQGINNMMVGTSEYSAAMAAFGILGNEPEFYSESFWIVFVDDAINFANALLLETREAARNRSERVRLDHDYCHQNANNSADENNTTDDRGGQFESFQETNRSSNSRNFVIDDEGLASNTDEDEFTNVFDMYRQPPDSSSFRGDKDYSVNNDSAAGTLFKTKDGPVIVKQCENYAFRGDKLKHLSLFEYAGMVLIVPVKEETDRSKESNSKSRAGRHCNKSYLFAHGHKLEKTHTQKIRSKFLVPIPVQFPPPPPPARPEETNDRWEKQANNYAAYMLVLFKPWNSMNGKHPGSLTYQSFCEFIKQLKENAVGKNLPYFISRVRLQWILNMSRNLKVDADERKATQECRCRDATIWNVTDNTSSLLLPNEESEWDEVASRTEEEESRIAAAAAAINELIESANPESRSNQILSRQASYIQSTMKELEHLFSKANKEIYNIATAEFNNELFNLTPISSPFAIYEAIAKDNEEEDVRNTTLGEPLPPRTTPYIPEENPPITESTLNTKQSEILKECEKFFSSIAASRISKRNPPTPLRLLVSGGPGTGKSFLTNAIYKAAKKHGLYVGCCATTGIAATNMPEGRTIHNFHGISPSTKFWDWANPPSKKTLGDAMRHFKREKIVMVIIDEISALKPEFLAIVDQRLRTLTGKYDEEFGGLSMILVGDFYQLPPVKAKATLYSAVLDFEKISPQDSPALAHGASLFQTFRLKELTEQMRAPDDSAHMGMLDRLRNPPTGQSPVSQEDLSKIKFLSTDDIKNDESWVTAPIIVITNKERHSYNGQQSHNFAQIKGKIRYIWNLPIRGEAIADLSQAKINDLYRNNVELKNYFVRGAPGYLTKNINPALGLANGTAVVYHSLILDNMEDSQTILERTRNATSAIDILLQYPPKFVCVEVPTADHTRFANRTLVPGKVVIPIPIIKDDKEVNLQSESINITVLTEKHSVDLKFSLTAHKVQGQTCSKLILDLNKRPFPPAITLNSLYVQLSRVKSSNSLRLLPFQLDQHDFKHLSPLKWPKTLSTWRKGFEVQTGYWNQQLALTTQSKPAGQTGGRRRSRKQPQEASIV